MPKRILIFSLSYYPHLIGGAEVAIKEITDRISPQEMEFDMVTLYAGKTRQEKIGNVNIYRVGMKIHVQGSSMPRISFLTKAFYVFSAFLKALILHHRRKYNLIWSVIASFNSFSALFFKMIHKNVPFLLTLQEGDTFEHIKKQLGPMYQLYLKIFAKADRIQVISNFLGDFARKMGAKCPIDIVPNGVDSTHFSRKPTSGQEKALLEELDLKDSDKLIISTGRLVSKNGIGNLIDAMAHLPLETKLLLVGTGPLENILKEKASLQKIGDRIRFAGFVPNRELPMYLAISDIFVRPSLSEGFGISFVEAMAAGLPVVATKVGGIVDFLKDEETGLFCEVNNPQSIALQIEKLLADESLRINLVKNAREMVRSKYDWNLVAMEMKEVLGSI